ncbi:MAG: class I SAM-dependent methyltransferase [Promethearchaeota archaeon]
MYWKAMEPFGLALKEFYEGNKDTKIVFYRDDGLEEEVSLLFNFRSENTFPSIEKQALALCHGSVLDIGAGVGPHSLVLQKQGLEVLAIDISPYACEIMRKRGVKNVKCSTVYELKNKTFDTILLMGRSIGFVENLSGLSKFLNYCKKILNPAGIILFDSIDIRMTTNQVHLAYQEENVKKGHYLGEIRLQIKFGDVLGEKFQWLHIDPQTLNNLANNLDWMCEILHKDEYGAYLAKIKR